MFGFLKGMRGPHRHSQPRQSSPASTASPAEREGEDGSSRSRSGRGGGGGARPFLTQEGAAASTPREEGRETGESVSASRHRAAASPPLSQPAQQQQQQPLAERAPPQSPTALSPSSSRLRPHRSASRRSVERLLSHYPAVGSPAEKAAAEAAAEEEEEDERQGRDAAYAPAPSPALHKARVKQQSLFEVHRSTPNAAVAVADSPQRTSTPSTRHTAKRGKANMSPSNPLFVSEDEVFTRYLRRVNPSTHNEGAAGGAREKETSPQHRHRHRHRSRSKQPRDSAQIHNGSRGGTSLLVDQDDTRVDDGDRSGRERRKARPHSRAASSSSKRIGAVAYTSSSSSSSTDGDEHGSGGENGGRQTVKRSASSQPLVDASAVFKLSPVDEKPKVSSQQQHNTKHTRSSVISTKGILKFHKASAAVAVEDAESSSSSSSSTSSLSVQQRVLSPPPPLPSAPPPNYNSSKRQRRHVRPTDSDEDNDNRVLLETSPEEVYTHHNQNGLSRGGLKGSAERRRSVSRNGEDPSLRTQRPERVPSAPVAREAAVTAIVPPSSFSLSPLEEAEQAWSFMDMAADISNTPHHHHAAAPTPAPMGTRRLHTAWSSYLQHHGQPHLYEPEGSMRDCVPHQQQQQQKQGQVTANAGVVSTRRHGNREDADVAAAAAAAALHARLMRSEQNVLLLRGSLLMTYTLLAAQGDVAATRRLTTGAAARRWRRELDRYAGWTEAAEGREQQQLKNNKNHESDRLRSGRGGSDSNDRGGTTPWPGLEARLDAAVRTIAQNLTNQRVDKRTTTPNNEAVAGSESGRGQTPPRLLLRETPAHDLGGLPSLWYPPHRSDAVGPVSGILSVWFSRGEDEGESEEDEAAKTSGVEEESVMESAAQISTYSAGDDTAAVPPRSRSGFRSFFSRASSSAAARGATPTRSLSAPPPRQTKATKKKKRSRSASTSSAAGLKGAWRRCFVVADDRDVRVYPAERDYADFADERLLMSVPFTSLAYLIPDFAEAAAALAADTSEERHASSSAAAATATPSDPTAVHVCTVAAVGNAIGATAHGGGGSSNGDSAAEATYTYFGFVHRQTPAVERRVAAACAAGPSLVQALRGRLISGSNGVPLRFAASRVESTRSTATTKRGSSVDLPHPPLLFRTQSRLAHAEWVHFFAYKFNRHLYQLLFPTTAAAMAGVGLRSAATQTTPETQQLPDVGDVAVVVAKEARDAPEEARRRHRRRHSRHRSRGISSRHRRDDDEHGADSNAESEENARSQRADTSPSRSTASAPPSPPDITNQFARALPHTQETTTTAAAAEDTASPSLLQAMTALRHALEERDAQVRSLEAEQAALTKSLRARERQVHDLQREQTAQQERLADALAQLDCQKSVADSQQKEVQRLRASADSVPPRMSSGHHHNHHNYNDGDAELVEALEEMAAAHTRESARLHEQLTNLQRRYTADQAAWRAEQQTLERRCQLTEVQVQNLRDGAAHEVRSLARQVVRDLDNFHSEVTHGTERCVASMIDESERANLRRLQAPANLCESEADSTFPRGNTAVVPASAALALEERKDKAGAARSIPIASLLLTYADGDGAVVDGELVVDEAAASVLFSGPTANQRGRRWELRHHVTDALLRIQLELLSRAPGDRRMSPSASPVAVLHGTPRKSCSRSRATTPLQTPSHPSTLLQQQKQQQRRLRASSEERPRALCQAERRRDAAAAAERPLLSAVLRAANAAPRDTRASRLRQAAIERQIQEREELDEA